MNVHEARRQAQEFLSATTDTVLEFWRDMPDEWTPASKLGVLPQRTNKILHTLRRVGAVRRRREGKWVFYQPVQQIVLDQLMVDRLEPRAEVVQSA